LGGADNPIRKQEAAQSKAGIVKAGSGPKKLKGAWRNSKCPFFKAVISEQRKGEIRNAALRIRNDMVAQMFKRLKAR